MPQSTQLRPSIGRTTVISLRSDSVGDVRSHEEKELPNESYRRVPQVCGD
jgi:hypothetical protein